MKKIAIFLVAALLASTLNIYAIGADNSSLGFQDEIVVKGMTLDENYKTEEKTSVNNEELTEIDQKDVVVTDKMPEAVFVNTATREDIQLKNQTALKDQSNSLTNKGGGTITNIASIHNYAYSIVSTGVAKNGNNALVSLKQVSTDGNYDNVYGTDIAAEYVNLSSNTASIKSYSIPSVFNSYLTTGVESTSTGFVIIAQGKRIDNTGYDIVIIKTDLSGNLLSSCSINKYYDDYPDAIKRNTDGSYFYIAGDNNNSSYSDMNSYLYKLPSTFTTYTCYEYYKSGASDWFADAYYTGSSLIIAQNHYSSSYGVGVSSIVEFSDSTGTFTVIKDLAYNNLGISSGVSIKIFDIEGFSGTKNTVFSINVSGSTAAFIGRLDYATKNLTYLPMVSLLTPGYLGGVGDIAVSSDNTFAAMFYSSMSGKTGLYRFDSAGTQISFDPAVELDNFVPITNTKYLCMGQVIYSGSYWWDTSIFTYDAFSSTPTPVPTPTALNVISSNPTYYASNITTSIAPSITFDQGILAGTAYTGITFRAGSTNVSFTPSINGSTLTLTPSVALSAGTTYTITVPVNAIKNASGGTLASNFVLTFTTGIVITQAYVISSNPTNYASNIATSIAPSITFDQGILAGTAYTGITFRAGSTNVSFTPSISGSTLTLTPSVALSAGTTYTITVPVNAIKNASGGTMASNYVLNFTTAAVTPTPAPVSLNVISSNPTNYATNIATSIAPSITFDQGILAGTVYTGITFRAGSTNVSFTPSISGSALTLTPSVALLAGTTYTITVPVNAVKNVSGGTLASNYVLNFTIIAAPSSTTLTVGSVTGKAGDTVDVPISITNNPGIATFGFKLNYDSNCLTPISCTSGSVWMGGITFNPNYATNQALIAGSSSSNYTGNGTFFIVKFLIKAGTTDQTVNLNLIVDELKTISGSNQLAVSSSIFQGSVVISNIKKGDVNGDGVVTPSDATEALMYYAGLKTLTATQISAADVNADGRVTPSDATSILMYYAGLVTW